MDVLLRLLVLPFVALSALGLALSVASHVASFFDSQFPLGNNALLLHVGIFVVWLPAVLVGNRLTRGASRKDQLKVALRGCPLWMRRAVQVLFVYAIANFAVFLIQTPKHQSHSGPMPPLVVRGFSGHWMIFYAAAFAVLYSAYQLPSWDSFRLCPSGHRCDLAASFCAQCGAALPA